MKLDDTLWAYRTAFKILLGMSPYHLIYEKVCHLLVEVEDKTYWATKEFNMNCILAGNKKLLQLSELEEL